MGNEWSQEEGRGWAVPGLCCLDTRPRLEHRACQVREGPPPSRGGGGGKPECSGKVKGKSRKHKLWGSQWCTLHIQWPLGGAAPSWTVGKETEITASEQVVGQLLKIPSSREGVTLQNTASLCFSGKCSRIPAHPLDLIKVVGVVKLGAGGG